MAGFKQILLKIVVKIFNVVYSILQSVGIELIPVSLDEVVRELTAAEKEEFLKQDFIEPVKFILEACNAPGNSFSGIQRFFLTQMIRLQIQNLSAVKMEVAKNPDILSTPVDGPIVIIGLARCGTTMLHRLLACDPQFVSPMTWEMMKPTPAGRPENWRESQRFKEASKMFDRMQTAYPDDVQAMHYFGVDSSEECLMILGNCFLNIVDSIQPDLEKWRKFQVSCPREYLKKAYEYYKQALQCLFYKNLDGNKRLLLKAPTHAMYLDVYRKILPNAKFIFMHRNLQTIVNSSTSLMEGLMRMQAIEGGNDLAKKWTLDLFKACSERAVAEFKQMDEDSFLIMGYRQLMKDPMAEVGRIYSHFKLELTPEVEASMRRHLEDNKQNKFGKHKYNVAENQVTREELIDVFGDLLDYLKDTQEDLL